MSRVAQPNETFDFVYNDCGKTDLLNSMNHQFEPYLYPFVIEYCILLVGFWCKIYGNMNHCPRKAVTTNCDGADALTTQRDENSESKRFNCI